MKDKTFHSLLRGREICCLQRWKSGRKKGLEKDHNSAREQMKIMAGMLTDAVSEQPQIIAFTADLRVSLRFFQQKQENFSQHQDR